jgi:hypothetical protein
MKTRSLMTLILRIMAVVLFIRIFTSMLAYGAADPFTLYFPIILTAVISSFLMAFSKPLARVLTPAEEPVFDDADTPSALALQPLAFAAAGLLLAVVALSQIPAALIFVLSQSDSTGYMPPEVKRLLWCERAEPYFLLAAGMVLIIRAHHISSLWNNFTFGRYEE